MYPRHPPGGAVGTINEITTTTRRSLHTRTCHLVPAMLCVRLRHAVRRQRYRGLQRLPGGGAPELLRHRRAQQERGLVSRLEREAERQTHRQTHRQHGDVQYPDERYALRVQQFHLFSPFCADRTPSSRARSCVLGLVFLARFPPP